MNPSRGFLILSTAIQPKLSMNSLLYISKARGKYIVKNTSWKKIRPSHKNTHLWQCRKLRPSQKICTSGNAENYVPPIQIRTSGNAENDVPPIKICTSGNAENYVPPKKNTHLWQLPEVHKEVCLLTGMERDLRAAMMERQVGRSSAPRFRLATLAVARDTQRPA